MDRFVTRRRIVQVGAAGVGALTLGGARIRFAAAQPPPLQQKDSYRVAFAQVEENNPWRIAQTESMRSEAERLGHKGRDRVRGEFSAEEMVRRLTALYCDMIRESQNGSAPAP